MAIRLFIALIIFDLSNAKSVLAEIHCQTDISYSWKRTLLEPNPASETKEGTSNDKEDSTAAHAEQATDTEQVYWNTIKGKGEKEEEVKQRVTNFANKEKTAALAACRSNHENLSGCISAKFSSVGPTMGSLGFAARKSIEEAISKDCEHQQGRCLDSTIGEIKCSEIVAATPAAEEKEDKKEGDKAGAKGKKK